MGRGLIEKQPVPGSGLCLLADAQLLAASPPRSLPSSAGEAWLSPLHSLPGQTAFALAKESNNSNGDNWETWPK